MIWDIGNGVAYEYVVLELVETPLVCELFNAKAELAKAREEKQLKDTFEVSVHFTDKDIKTPFLDIVCPKGENSDEELEPILISAEEFKEAKTKFSAGMLTIINESETKMEIGYVDNEWIILSAFIEKRVFNALISLLKDYGVIDAGTASELALS